MGFRTDYPLITITIRRDQKEWLARQNTVNFSGYVQDQLDMLMRYKDKQRKALLKELPPQLSNY
jgi:hypothetical protein